MTVAQAALFDDLPPSPQALPEGLVYEAGFLDAAEEAGLVALMARLPLKEAQYKSYTARRRVVSYGGRFDYDTHELLPTGPLIEALHPLRARVARWAGVEPQALAHALLRLRPDPPLRPRREDIVKLPLAPRSIYAMRGPARWAWQHSVAPVDATRWSITFRTARR